MISLYSSLDQLAAESEAESEIPEPEPIIPLNSVLDLNQMDGSMLTLNQDGLGLIRTPEGITQTMTISSSLILSTTTALIESGLLQAGLEGFLSEEEANVLFVRGPLGVYTVRWMEDDHPGMEIILAHIESIKQKIESNVIDINPGPAEPTIALSPTPETE